MKMHSQPKRWVEVVEYIVFTIVVSVLLNVSAGPTAYWQAGVYALVCFACVLPIFFYLVEHPALFKRRISFGPRAEHETSQKIIVSFLLLLYATVYVVAGLDHRFNWSHVPVPVVLGGDLLFAGGLVLIFLVFRANTFAAATITVEAEQSVIATGPNALVRHPLYSGLLCERDPQADSLSLVKHRNRCTMERQTYGKSRLLQVQESSCESALTHSGLQGDHVEFSQRSDKRKLR